MKFFKEYHNLFIISALLFLILAIVIKPIVIPSNYLDVDQFSAKVQRGENGGFPKENEKIFVYGRLTTYPFSYQVLTYDPKHNLTVIALYADTDMSPPRFSIEGNKTDLPLARGNYIILSTIWNDSILEEDQRWTIERYDLPLIVLQSQAILIISSTISFAIGIILYIDKKSGKQKTIGKTK